MPSVATENALELLEGWLSGGLLDSEYFYYIDTQICARNSPTFYNRIKAEKGQEAADKALEAWNSVHRMKDFASGIKPVARGMLEIARADSEGKYVAAISVTNRINFPTSYNVSGPSELIVVFNFDLPRCGCSQPEGTLDFSRYGRLGLKAATLQVGKSPKSGSTAQLGLVLPYRPNPGEYSKIGYVVVTIELNGHSDGHRYFPSLRDEDFLLYSLGLADIGHCIDLVTTGGGHIDDVVGFPGATNYLADSLPKLGEYFTELAARLTPGHEHK